MGGCSLRFLSGSLSRILHMGAHPSHLHSSELNLHVHSVCVCIGIRINGPSMRVLSGSLVPLARRKGWFMDLGGTCSLGVSAWKGARMTDIHGCSMRSRF